VDVRVAFCEQNFPNLRDVLAATGRHAVVVPLLLADAYHARVDIPALITESGTDAKQADVLGEDDRLIAVLRQRLTHAGVSQLDPAVGVLVTAVGSSRPQANARTAMVADHLADRAQRPRSRVDDRALRELRQPRQQLRRQLEAHGHERGVELPCRDGTFTRGADGGGETVDVPDDQGFETVDHPGIVPEQGERAHPGFRLRDGLPHPSYAPGVRKFGGYRSRFGRASLVGGV